MVRENESIIIFVLTAVYFSSSAMELLTSAINEIETATVSAISGSNHSSDRILKAPGEYVWISQVLQRLQLWTITSLGKRRILLIRVLE